MRRPPALIGVLWLASVAMPLVAQTSPPRLLTLVDVLKGTDEVQLRWPVAVAAASDKRVAIADAHAPKLVAFARIGASWGLDQNVELPAAPVALTWQDDRWVVALRDTGGLLAVDVTTGNRSRLALPAEVVPGALAAVPGRGLLVVDLAGRRVLRLDRNANLTGETRVDQIITDLTPTQEGGFLATDAENGRILQFGGDGSLLGSWELPGEGPVAAWPKGIAIDPSGRTFVVDRHNGRILILDSNGNVIGLGSRLGWDAGLLRFPAGLAWIPGGSVLVADQGNGRAQIFRITNSPTEN